MTLDDLRVLKGSSSLPFPISSKGKQGSNLVINHKVAFPVILVSSHFNTSADIPIFNDTGDEVAVLCFTREFGKKTWNELTSDQFIVFLNEVDYNKRFDSHAFDSNYIVIKDSFYQEYKRDFQETSPLWGGFAHYHADIITNNQSVIVPSIHLKKLKLIPKIFLENATRAIAQPYGFERFLKLYHLLELRFDYDVIKKVKAMDVDLYPEEIGNLLSEYSRTEIKRLTEIISSYCIDIPQIVNRLNGLKHFASLANDLFYKFGTGRESNPLKDVQTKFNVTLPLGFEEPHLRTATINYNGNYTKFIQQFVAYVIYRVRCSIAHNKLGEYILSMNEENFIVEFAEPLLKEVLFQCFKP